MEHPWVFTAHRRVGHTTAAVQGAKSGAVLIVADQSRADRLSKEHGIRAVRVGSERLYGSAEAWVFDVDAVQRIVSDYEQALATRDAELAELRSELEDARRSARGEDDLRRQAEAECARLRAAMERIGERECDWESACERPGQYRVCRESDPDEEEAEWCAVCIARSAKEKT